MRIRNAPLFVVTFLGLALRLIYLHQPSLWYDEAFSLAVARADWPIFWEALLSDGVHPPGYYLLLRPGLLLFGNSEFALRFPSVVAGTLALPLIYQLGRTLGGRRWGLAAALLLALNPFALWYSQEARMYGLLLCLTVAGGYAFCKLLIQPNLKHWLGLTLASALGFAIHYFAFVFSLAQFVYVVIHLKKTYHALRWWAAAQFVAFLPFAPWAVTIATREGRNFGIGWIPAPTILDPLLTLSNLTLALDDPGHLWTWLGLALVIGAITVGIVATAQSRQSRISSYSLLPTSYSFLFIWLIVPIAFTWLLSLRQPLYVDRFLIICLPPLILLISTISLSSSPRAYGTIAVLAVLSLAASARLWTDPRFAKEDWRAAADYIQSNQQPDDALVIHDFQVGIPFGYYYRGGLEVQVANLNQQTYSLDELTAGRERVWIVYRRPFEPTHDLAGSEPFTWRDDHEPPTGDWLVAHQSQLAQEREFPGVYILLYQLTPSSGATNQ